MRKVKNFLSIALAVMLVLGSICIPFSASAETKFNDVADDYTYYKAIYDLVNKGIIDGYLNEDGSKSFKPEATITRAEFAKLLSVTVNKGVISDVTTTAFEDVNSDPTVSWAIPYIDSANKAGIINGYEDGTFRAKNPVSYAEAVKMVVCALGYGPVVKMTDVWYEGYINIANQIGITKGAAAVADSEAPRGLVAQLVYNMTVTSPLVQVGTDKEGNPVYEQDDTGKLSGKTITGILKAVGPREKNNLLGTHISGVSAGHIVVETSKGDEIFSCSQSEASLLEMLGYNVEVSYEESASIPEVKTIVRAATNVVYELGEDKGNEIISVASNGASLTYENGNRNKTLGLDANMYLVYNGKGVGTLAQNAKGALIANLAAQSGSSMIGEGKFIDADGDGDVDAAFVNAYKTYYVSYKDSSSGSNVIVTDSNTNETVNLTASEVVIKKVKADKTFDDDLTYDAISEDNIISVGSSYDNSMKVIIISDLMAESSTNAEVLSIDSTFEEIVIGRNPYKASKYYINNPNQSFTVGSKGTFYLDFTGKIAAVKVSGASNGDYGYLVSYSSGVNLSNPYITIWNSSTGLKVYEISSNLKVNGSDCNDLTTALSASASSINANKNAGFIDSLNPYSQLVRFNTSGDKITSLMLVGTNGITLNDRFETVGDATAYTSRSNGFALTSGNVRVDSNTEVYFIPETNRTTENKYMYRKGNSYFVDGVQYNVEAYDVKDGAAGALIVYGKPKLINGATGAVVVKQVNPGRNSKGEQATKITYYALDNESVNSAAEKDVSLNLTAGIDTGDIIRLVLDDNGDIEELEKVYDMSAGTFFNAATTANGPQTQLPATTYSMQISHSGVSDYFAAYKGTANNKGESVISIVPEYVADDGNGNVVLSSTNGIDHSVDFGTVSVYVYDSSETASDKKLQPGSTSNIAYYDFYKNPNDQGKIDASNASKVVAVRASGSRLLTAIIIYK